MRPFPYVWPYAAIFWVAFVWAYWRETPIVRRAKKEQGASDAKSLQVIIAGQSLAFFAAFPLSWVPAVQFSRAEMLPAFVVGLAMLVGGALLRRHCFRILGASFTGDVRARSDQQVITNGAYRWLRHPSYTGGILMNTGVGVAMGTWLGALLLAATSAAVYLYRITIEERTLAATIGAPYREFMRTRKRLIPFVY